MHDQIDTEVREDFAKEWSVTITKLMEQAGAEILGEGLLKADTTLTDRWTK